MDALVKELPTQDTPQGQIGHNGVKKAQAGAVGSGGDCDQSENPGQGRTVRNSDPGHRP